jgi:cystathionine beta-lyase
MMHAYTQPGDSVLVCTPVYYPFFHAINNTGRKLVECELTNSNGLYSLDLDKFEQHISVNKIKLFILCSPHNPVGRVWTELELTGILEICRKYNVIVVSDEVHQDMISSGFNFISSSTIADGKYKDILVTLTAASKTFNLAGLIHSHVIIFDEKLRARYDDFILTIGKPPVNILSLLGTEAAYRHGAQWLKGLNAVIQKNYAYMKDEFAAKASKVIISSLEGTYLMWMDLSPYTGTMATADFVQKKCRLAVNVGERFIKQGGEGFIRINLATLPKYVEYAAKRIIDNL